ncbi:hypothetical protein [Oceanobacillus luteolus]|uniref:Uncharacterized protein n=1 Tax=Oceanobacillus luteolus TaxID=1274358 RepID=A0ABW4HPF5_9BACI
MLRMSIAAIVILGFLTGFINANSSTESVVWLVLGCTGLLGAVTWGYSSRQIIQAIKNSSDF